MGAALGHFAGITRGRDTASLALGFRASPSVVGPLQEMGLFTKILAIFCFCVCFAFCYQKAE
jgi:hypothetical protein